MCGISGYYSHQNIFSKNDLEKMTAALAHRGPDAAGFYSDEIAGLGHRRLSILDLSMSANQPMHSQCGRYTICYNGEVYNFRDIAKELGLDLITTSDTEVILETFIKKGIGFTHLLNGMFSIAIYDKLKMELFIFRDRIGVKPLYYYWDSTNFVFASEIKSLLQVDLIKNNSETNKSAIYHFLHLGYIPEPETIYSNISKFPAGHFAVLTSAGLTIKSWWKPEDQITDRTINDFKTAKKQFKELITSSVNYRLISDVPYGTFLSGGTDSSLITAVAQQQTGKIKTFSIGFKEEKYNETEHARSIANHLRTEHHELMASHIDALELFNEVISTYDEPFADSSAIPTMLVSKMARQSVKMVLSGDGGDELFLGYGAYRWAKRMDNFAINFFRKPISAILSKMNNREQRAAYIFNYQDKKRLKSHIFSQEQYLFSKNEIRALLQPEYYRENHLEEDYSFLPRKLKANEQQALFDIKNYLKDDLLVKVDRASMKYGLEVRTPLLDYRIVEFALNLSPELKSNSRTDKYLLKEVLYDYIPKKLLQRPKRGFAIPLQLWLKKELRYLIDDNLNEKTIQDLGIVSYKAVAQLKTRFFKGEDYLYNRIWALVVLHSFFKYNK